MIERLADLTKRRLRRWAATGLFGRERAYSFRDAVTLRMLEMLRTRKTLGMRRLRVAAEALTDLADDVWRDTTVWVVDRTVVLQPPARTRRKLSRVKMWPRSD